MCTDTIVITVFTAPPNTSTQNPIALSAEGNFFQLHKLLNYYEGWNYFLGAPHINTSTVLSSYVWYGVVQNHPFHNYTGSQISSWYQGVVWQCLLLVD